MKDNATVVATTTLAVVAPREPPTGEAAFFELSSIYTSGRIRATVEDNSDIRGDVQRDGRGENVEQVTASSLAIEIIQVLRDRGHTAYFVGGCVRDRLLGGNPKDYDIATNARPDEIVRYFPRAEKVGAHFGVILVRGAAGVHVEVATFRSDHSYSDGRRPDRVEFETDPRQDVLRRDFTINA